MAKQKINSQQASIPQISRKNNTTDSMVNDSRIETGWGYVTGNGANNVSTTITFNSSFSSSPIFLVTPLGFKPSPAPTDASQFTTSDAHYVVGRPTSTNASVTVLNRDTSGDLTSGVYFGFSWIAIGV